ncbi:21542_t:CDS:2 [Entrophospora sp. SA101]|nr:21542_t:CDS:2 [Entrophospora sp. SA101]
MALINEEKDSSYSFEFGGKSMSHDIENFFYLNVSTAFNLNYIPWTSLSSVNYGSPRTIGASCVNEAKNDSIFYIGGITSESSRIEKFDIFTQTWSRPIISGNVPTELLGIQCVASKDAIYTFGGNSLNHLYKLNTTDLTWLTFSSLDAPSPRVRYSATLLPNGDVLYISGRYFSDFSLISMEKIPTYNINNDSWRIITTSGETPLPRAGHTANFIPQHNQILIIDGWPNVGIVALDTITFAWSVPEVSIFGGISPGLFWHTSTLIGNYIVVAFGEYEDYEPLSGIHLLDISQKNNYTWVSSFVPPNTTVNSSSTLEVFAPTEPLLSMESSPPTSSNPVGALIGGIIGGAVVLVLLVTAISFEIRRVYRKRRSSNIKIDQDQDLSNQKDSDNKPEMLVKNNLHILGRGNDELSEHKVLEEILDMNKQIAPSQPIKYFAECMRSP